MTKDQWDVLLRKLEVWQNEHGTLPSFKKMFPDLYGRLALEGVFKRKESFLNYDQNVVSETKFINISYPGYQEHFILMLRT